MLQVSNQRLNSNTDSTMLGDSAVICCLPMGPWQGPALTRALFKDLPISQRTLRGLEADGERDSELKCTWSREDRG